MNRIDTCFNSLKAAGRTGLIPFVTAGDPHPDWTAGILHGLVRGGASLLELGIPFSDPMADGPVIQKASERALVKGMNVGRTLEIVRQFRQTDTTTPIVLMGYLNPIEYFGYEDFAKAATEAGVDGVLLVDCPPEEAQEIQVLMAQHGLQQIFLASPTTTDTRIDAMARLAQGYVYYVSFAGITGADRLVLDDANVRLDALKSQLPVPVAVGFGIKSPAQAAAFKGHAAAVVVGSALVEALAGATSGDEAATIAQQFVEPLSKALAD